MSIKILFLLLFCNTTLLFSEINTTLEPIIAGAIQLASDYIQDRSQPIPIIAVGGCAAVGKTYFAETLVRALRHRGINALLLRQDDYLNMNKIFPGYKIHPNLDHEALHAFLRANSVGVKKITKSFLTSKEGIVYKTLNLARVDVIVFEGIYALTGVETYNFAQYCSMGIFLDAMPTNIVKWHAQRNGNLPFFKRLDKQTIKQHATCLLYEYHKFIVPSKNNADFIVYKDAIDAYRLL